MNNILFYLGYKQFYNNVCDLIVRYFIYSHSYTPMAIDVIYSVVTFS